MKYPSKFAEVPFQNSKWRTTKLLVDISYLNEHKHKKMFRIKKKWKEGDLETKASI